MYTVAATVHSVVIHTLICTSAFSVSFASLTTRLKRPQGSKTFINANDTKTDVIKYGSTLRVNLQFLIPPYLLLHILKLCTSVQLLIVYIYVPSGCILA